MKIKLSVFKDKLKFQLKIYKKTKQNMIRSAWKLENVSYLDFIVYWKQLHGSQSTNHMSLWV